MDAPLHMVEGGYKIADIDISHFQGRGVLIDARNKAKIDIDLLEEKTIKRGDIILIWTGWDKKYRNEEYFKSWPIITKALADYLVKKEISIIGMDTAGPDDDEQFVTHKIFLPNNILIIENMTMLELLEPHKDFTVHAYPAKYDADAAPVRVVAEVN